MNDNKPQTDKHIYNKYREILEMPHLTNEEVERMRPHVLLLARTICEHVWGKEFY